jgi:hypothetical protein
MTRQPVRFDSRAAFTRNRPPEVTPQTLVMNEEPSGSGLIWETALAEISKKNRKSSLGDDQFDHPEDMAQFTPCVNVQALFPSHALTDWLCRQAPIG